MKNKIPTLLEIQQYFLKAKTVKWTGENIPVDFDNIHYKVNSRGFSYNGYYTDNWCLFDGKDYANIVEEVNEKEYQRRLQLINQDPQYEIY